jgi:predicted porin
MKKIAKLSLVAAMAVTAANAVALEEAIKNVDVSGKVYVEFLADSNKAPSNNGKEETASKSDIDVDITFKSKVNDNITSVVRVQADNGNGDDENGKITAGQDVTVDNVYFTYQNGGLTVMTGKQDINTPNTDGEVGNGVLALYNAGFATVAAGHFVQNEEFTGDVSALAVLGSLGPVNAEAWYVRVGKDNTIGDGTDHFTLVASTKVGPVSLGARHAITDFDGTTKDRNSTKVTAAAAFGPVGVNATYFTTDKDGAAYVTDASSANTYELSQLGIENQADIDLWALGASYTMDAMKYQVDYATYDQDINKVEADELRLRATYTMSKNFQVMATYSMYEVETDNATTTEKDSARLEAKYSF